jgi:4-coumarate--CoA ligase
VDSYDLSSLKLIMSGAAPLGSQTTTALRERLGCASTQGYGLTELSPVTHAFGSGDYRAGSVGRLVASTRCRIVGSDGSDCGPDEEGEIWIHGPQVMLGYLNNPAATRNTISEDGWLRTGDLGSVDKDGFLFVRDRLKELIKVNGFAVAPAEIEACLNNNPAIADAAVIGIPDAETGERPMAFVVRASGATVGEEDVMAHVAANLSRYKLPAKVRFVDTIPKSASGKILRRLLRDQISGSG